MVHLATGSLVSNPHSIVTTMAVSLAVSTQYTNVIDTVIGSGTLNTQRTRHGHRMTATEQRY